MSSSALNPASTVLMSVACYLRAVDERYVQSYDCTCLHQAHKHIQSTIMIWVMQFHRQTECDQKA
jgi:hypothetical protein